ncbi:hypothetical protein [Chitinophaga sp. MM2321]|uniref:hypothetical protein n=1 Tax=Chitinophaga sp. MM2321 TaxID=3137178 RepID=UPI0032D57C81
MYRYIVFLLTALFISTKSKAQEAYGLEFASKNIAQETRTSLNLFPEKPLQVTNGYSVSFDLSFMPFYASYFGYVLRMIDEKKQNIDLIYNVHTRSFDVVTGNEFSGISFKIGVDSLYHQWNKITLDCNTNTHILSVTVNGKHIKSIRSPVVSGKRIGVCFGAHHRRAFKTFDLPPMRIKDVQIYQDNVLQHHWPLDQTKGNTDKDLITGQLASIKNPVWLRPKFSQWQLTDSFVVNGNASVALDPVTESVYVSGKDSMYNYNCGQQKKWAKAFAGPQGTPAGIQAAFDWKTNKLYTFFIDSLEAALYDSVNNTWSQHLPSNGVTTYWHSNIFFSPFDSSIYTLGGYGDFRYKNEVHRYMPDKQQWDTIHVDGDHLTPRYLSALGTNETGDSAYILGGYGSLEGDQLLNPHNLYDMVLFDVKNKTFKTIYKFKEPEEPFAFANNMIINSKKQEYYALIFANDRMNSSLQLIKGSLKEPVYTTLAASIPYMFYDIRSAARLFYCPQNDKLIAVTLFSLKNNLTQVHIYTLQFSPYGLEVKAPAGRHTPMYVMRILIAAAVALVLFLLAIGILLSGRRKNNHLPENKKRVPNETKEPVNPVATEAPVIISPTATVAESQLSAVFLFGHFTVLDKAGNDITKSFSPLLKELFLLLFLHSLMGKNGISSERINELLWPGRSVKDAKNNRSVNIVKLKSILDKTGAYTLLKENDKWVFHFDDECIHVDLKTYLQLLQHTCATDIAGIARIAGIVKRGAFLLETEYAWLDKFKADISTKAIPLLISFLDREAHHVEPEFVIDICDCILNFDSLSEEAVMFKCKALVALRQHASARKIYTSFIAEYKSIYGEAFEMEYTKVIEQYQ